MTMDLTDLDADRHLLDLPGTTLLVFSSRGCATCRHARRVLPGFGLPVERIAWVDAGENGGLVQRYEVFHLPALFVIRDGQFFGEVHAPLSEASLNQAIASALCRVEDELP